MALINCSGCGQRISSRARTCPKCNLPQGPGDTPKTGAAVRGVEPGSEEAPPRGAAPAPSGTRDTGASGDQARPKGEGVAADPGWLHADGEEAAAFSPWYYVTASGRKGPTTLSLIRELAQKREIDPETPIWRSGMEDWVPLAKYREEDTPPVGLPADMVPLLPEKRSGKGLFWGVALAPAWGSVVQIVATEVWVAATHQRLDYYAQLWWITVALNLAVCYLDFSRFRKTTQDGETLPHWLWLIVPAYLNRRDTLALGKQTRLYLWTGSLLLALALFMFLNDVYLKMSPR